MKKTILSYASILLLSAALSACGSRTETKTETTTVETPAADAAKPAPESPAVSEAPTFSNNEVNKGIAEYRTLIDNYLAAIDSKDQAKISQLSAQYQQVSMNMSVWATKLRPDETEKFTQYMQALGKQWQAAAMKIAAHQ